MGKSKKSIFGLSLIFLIILFFNGCNKTSTNNNKTGENQLKKFSLKQFSNNFNIILSGEAAEVKKKNIEVRKPSLTINRKSEIVEIKTGKEGKAEIKINPDNQQIQSVVFSGDIKITQKDINTNKILMEARCGKLTYNDKTQEMVMEKSPVIKRGKSVFSGEKIFYYLEKNSLQIKGNVNVKIVPEK